MVLPVHASSHVHWRGEELKAAAAKAMVKWLHEGAKRVARTARKMAPEAEEHRVRRTYPGGRVFDDPKPIKRSIRFKVKASGPRKYDPLAYAYVQKAGYSMFVEHGHRIVGRDGTVKGMVPGERFMERAAEAEAPNLIRIFKGEVDAMLRPYQREDAIPGARK